MNVMDVWDEIVKASGCHQTLASESMSDKTKRHVPPCGTPAQLRADVIAGAKNIAI